jgi:hypothetical protein
MEPPFGPETLQFTDERARDSEEYQVSLRARRVAVANPPVTRLFAEFCCLVRTILAAWRPVSSLPPPFWQ